MIASRMVMLGLLAAGLASPAAAQLRRRSGFWMDAGVSIGRLRVTCRTCTPPASASGSAITLSFGGSPSRYVLLGVEAQEWTGDDASIDEKVRSVSVVAQWYPWRHNGFFLRGGTGLVDGTVAPNNVSSPRAPVKGHGIVIGVSIGWDQPLSRHFDLTLQAGDQIAALGDLITANGVADDTIAYVSRLGIALTLR